MKGVLDCLVYFCLSAYDLHEIDFSVFRCLGDGCSGSPVDQLGFEAKGFHLQGSARSWKAGWCIFPLFFCRSLEI